MAAFEEGHEKVGGRAPGTPNKLNAAVKDAIENAFEEVGGQKYLVRVAISDPKTFCALLSKLLPKDVQLTGKGGDPIQIIVQTGVTQSEPTKGVNGNDH